MNKHYHFIGIGGIGMGALASLLLDKGYHVSGSDARANQVTARLAERGAEIFLGHDAGHIGGADCVIFSSAITAGNPELREARHRNIPIMQRAKLLAELMEGYIGITVAGAHGKTTTTSMAANLLMRCGLRPTTAVGGIVNGSPSHAHTGEGKYFVTEVDESDGSFLNFSPHYSIITNIDFEHVDYYHNWPNILRAYRGFIDKTAGQGMVIIYGDDERLSQLLRESGRNFRTYGFAPRNDVYAADMSFDHFNSKFNCNIGGRDYGQVVLNVPGRHNVANAMACISLGLSLSLDFAAIVGSLKEFHGVQRRFQLKGRVDDVWVIDDYAHHPTEIKNTLATAELFKQSIASSLPGRQANDLIAVFQPHRYSRVNGLMEEFAESLTRCDHLIVTDIYAAGEQPIPGVTAEKLCERIRSLTDKPVRYLPKNEIVDYLLSLVKPHDLVMTLGAGDITRLSDELTEALKKQSTVTSKTE